MSERTTPITYRDAGVDIDAGNRLVEALKPLARATRRAGAEADLGGFGGLFDLKAAGFKDALIVATTDGVGTKLKLAVDSGRHDTIGIDLVAMCVNDLLAQGAEPLLFLDYFATGRLDVETARRVIAGIAAGCQQAGCALIGGETAEMPGVYQGGDYDLAGFSIGSVERGEVLPRSDIVAGDVLIGLGSSGVHSNGYSLVRRLVAEANARLDAPAPFEPAVSLAEALLRPTRIYVKPVLAAIRATGGGGSGGAVKAIAHITGGGLTDNLPRVLPETVAAEVDLSQVTVPKVFSWLAQVGRLDKREMLRTFNCGVGLVLVVDGRRAAEVVRSLANAGETPIALGRIVTGSGERAPSKGKASAWALRTLGKLAL